MQKKNEEQKNVVKSDVVNVTDDWKTNVSLPKVNPFVSHFVSLPIGSLEDFTNKTLQSCFSRPNVQEDKCQDCIYIDLCLEREADLNVTGTKTTKRGKDEFGFPLPSVSSQLAHELFLRPRKMNGKGNEDSIQSACPNWNPRRQTFYDAFNKLKRRVDADGNACPLANVDKDGIHFIVKSRLTDEQKNAIKDRIKNGTFQGSKGYLNEYHGRAK